MRNGRRSDRRTYLRMAVGITVAAGVPLALAELIGGWCFLTGLAVGGGSVYLYLHSRYYIRESPRPLSRYEFDQDRRS